MIRASLYSLICLSLSLFFQNCSYHKAGEDHKVLPFQQGPILSRNAALIEEFDMIFYVNRSLFPEDSTFQFDARINETVRCELIRVEDDWFQIQCPEPGTLKVIVFSIDPNDFSIAQEESTFQVIAKNQVTFSITEQRLFPFGREIPDTTFHPNEDPSDTVSGITLYNNYCLRCHGVVSSTTVNEKTLDAFKSSLDSITQMRNSPELRTLTDDEVRAIMDAL